MGVVDWFDSIRFGSVRCDVAGLSHVIQADPTSTPTTPTPTHTHTHTPHSHKQVLGVRTSKSSFWVRYVFTPSWPRGPRAQTDRQPYLLHAYCVSLRHAPPRTDGPRRPFKKNNVTKPPHKTHQHTTNTATA